MDSERAARYGRAAARWARLLAGGRATPGLRVFYGWDAIPGPGEPVAGGTAKLQKLAERWPNRPTDFSLLYLGTTYLPRDLRPLLWLARPARRADRRQPGRRRLPRLGGRAHRGAQRAVATRRPGGRSRRLPERVQQALVRPLPRRAAWLVGDPPERRRRRPLHPGRRAQGGPGRAPRRRPDPGLPARARARDVSPRARRPPRRAPPRRRASRLRSRAGAAAPRRWARRSSSSAGTRRLRRPTSTAGRTCCSTRRSTTPARRP